jgi:hypothetical protein
MMEERTRNCNEEREPRSVEELWESNGVKVLAAKLVCNNVPIRLRFGLEFANIN